jgi:hypothetical protein
MLVLGYIFSPIQLIPDFIPDIGFLDDADLVAIMLRIVMRTAGPQMLQKHWPGTPQGLQVVCRVCGLAQQGKSPFWLRSRKGIAPPCLSALMVGFGRRPASAGAFVAASADRRGASASISACPAGISSAIHRPGISGLQRVELGKQGHRVVCPFR